VRTIGEKVLVPKKKGEVEEVIFFGTSLFNFFRVKQILKKEKKKNIYVDHL
jgi:hypothetical protein